MRTIRRHIAVGATATAVDLLAVGVLVAVVGWHPAVGDAVAIVAATLVSYVLHRLVTYAADPSRRWFQSHLHYLAAATVALAADVAVFTAIAGSHAGLVRLALAKLAGLVAAFALRSVFFRRAMFEAVRTDQQVPLARPTPPGDVRLTLVIPAFKEESGIGATLDRVEADLGHLRDDGGFEIVVVDDGSPDGTAAAARAGGADRVIRLEVNSGKGAAVRAGMLAARGRTVAFTDADLSYPPRQVLGLMAEIEAGWDVVVGSRRHTETRTLVANRRLREVGGRVINLLTSLVLLGQYRDTQCGLKAFRSDVARVIFGHSHINGFAFDVEVFHLVERFRFTLSEVPVELVNSSRSTVRVARDAGRLVRDLFRIRRIGRAGGYEVEGSELPPLVPVPARS